MFELEEAIKINILVHWNALRAKMDSIIKEIAEINSEVAQV